MRQMGWNGNPYNPYGPGCTIPLGDGDKLQITWFGAYHQLDDTTSFIRPYGIHGLEGRQYALLANEKRSSSPCQIEINTQAITYVMINVYDDTRAVHHSRDDRCRTADRAADLIVRTFVPLAGGTVWDPTPQTIDPANLAGKTPCDLVGNFVRTDGGLADVGDEIRQTPDGPLCVAERQRPRGTTRIEALLAAATLTELGPLREADVTPRPFGQAFLGREERTKQACAAAAEIRAGLTLRITMEASRIHAVQACKAAETMMIAALDDMINGTSKRK